MKVSIIGTGYVGLVTGVCLAHKGHSVSCVDVDREKIARINRGEAPFFEPGLVELLRRSLRKGFSTSWNLTRAVLESDMTLLAVGTPFRGRRIDLRYVRQAARQVGEALARKRGYHVVVVKSTVVPGTTDGVVLPILERSSGKHAGRGFGLGMNPEFLSEGEAVRDFMQPDRIVLGGIDRRTIRALDQLYRPFSGVPILRTGTRTAEMIKYTSNALLANLISFSNEIGNFCAAVDGIDAEDVMRGVHLSQYLTPRLSSGRSVRAPITAFLRPGCGFGGSCLPKDVKALIARGREANCSMDLLRQVIRINDGQPARILELLRRRFDTLENLSVAVLGLSFKPHTDDLRESPAIPLVNLLQKSGARVKLYDPVAMPAARRSQMFDGAEFATSLQNAVGSARAAVIVTAWPHFRRLEKLPAPDRRRLVVVDGRRLLDRKRFARYEAIGLGEGA